MSDSDISKREYDGSLPVSWRVGLISSFVTPGAMLLPGCQHEETDWLLLERLPLVDDLVQDQPLLIAFVVRGCLSYRVMMVSTPKEVRNGCFRFVHFEFQFFFSAGD